MPTKRALGTLRAGARRVVKIRLTRRTSSSAAVRFAATGAGGLSAARTIRIPDPPAPTSGALAQRAYLRLISGSPGISQDRRTGYTFTGPKWVYRGNPEGGFPRCTKKTGGTDADGDPTDGCLPYAYDAKTGKLHIDGKPVKLNRDKSVLTVGENAFLLKPTFAPGARLAVSLKNIEVYGLWPNQSVFTSWITLTTRGEFAFSGSAIGSLGAGSPSIISSTISPDKRGTYEILSGSTIQFRYADGKITRRTILINGTPDRPSTKLDPQKEGLLLDGTAWWS